jgi:mannose-1-phosphate guanylyltransferase/mannose-6-phosphate isomerase
MDLSGEGVNVCSLFIVTNEEHRFLALEQLREISVQPGAALLEPLARNTAPALILAALAAVENGDDPVLVVTPADQTVTDAHAFTESMQEAIRQAAEGVIVILGVTPDRPETGFGYIKTNVASTTTHAVERFIEKPDEVKARQYLAEEGYYWNAGMFVLKASVWLEAIESFRPDIAATTRSAWARRSADAAFVRPGKTEFAAIPGDSVDYAVMERCPGSRFPIRMVPLDAGWSDLGAWTPCGAHCPRTRAETPMWATCWPPTATTPWFKSTVPGAGTTALTKAGASRSSAFRSSQVPV